MSVPGSCVNGGSPTTVACTVVMAWLRGLLMMAVPIPVPLKMTQFLKEVASGHGQRAVLGIQESDAELTSVGTQSKQPPCPGLFALSPQPPPSSIYKILN